jgi:uncharacterized membrane protein
MSLPIELHPMIVHTPIALIIMALLFDIVGRLTDLVWWRKAAFAMLVVGVVGAGAAVLSGNAAEEPVEDQGVPEHAIEAHQEAGIITLWLGVVAVIARALAARWGGVRGAFSAVALVAHLLTAGAVGVAGIRGGQLVFQHGAGVKAPAAPAHAGAQDGDDAKPGGAHRD